jgi:ADP-ribose pyrophosphatase YjhB (NUDIX family)
VTDLPLYQRDPRAWNDYLAEGSRTQARKRVSVDALILDEAGRILLVNPSYKPGWDLPGGMGEGNEPPFGTIRREVREELSIDLAPRLRLLVIDWVPPHGPWDDAIAMIVTGGAFTGMQISSIRLDDGEIDSYEFCTADEASKRLQPRTSRRLRFALEVLKLGQGALYLEDGYPVIDDARRGR